MDIKISIPKATKEEIRRGLAAASEVFRNANVSPDFAARGWAEREAWDISGFRRKVDPAFMTAAQVWDEADGAAADAACADWEPNRKRPQNANLELITDPETQLADRANALRMLRARAMAEDGKAKALDSKMATLGWVVAENLENQGQAQELVDDLTTSHFALIGAFLGEEPTEPKRQALLDAIDALEKATETAH